MVEAFDYTKEVKGIVQALNRASTALEEIVQTLDRSSSSVWLVPLISGLVGVVTGVLLHLLVLEINELRQRSNMRKGLYRDIAHKFFLIDYVMQAERVDQEQRCEWQEMHFSELLEFDWWENARQRQDIYFQLEERMYAEVLYRNFRRIVDEKKWIRVNGNGALRLTADFIKGGQLDVKEFRKCLSSGVCGVFMERVEYYHRQSGGSAQVQSN